MKRYKFLQVIILALIISITTSCNKEQSTNETTLEGEITLSGSFALYPLAVKWAEEFQKIYPKVVIDVTAGGTGKGVADALSQTVELGMVGREINEEEIKNGAWYVPVTKDAVLASASKNNPVIKDLLQKGLSQEKFKDIYITQKIKTWGEAVGTADGTKIELYKRSDAGGVTESWAKFLKAEQEEIQGIGIFGDPGVAEAVKKNPNGIGFNNTLYVYDASTRKPYDGIIAIPIDINNNGVIDPEENFYDSLDQLDEAINNGKYPSPPARELYFMSKGKPENKVTIAFLKWALTDGQKFCKESGYINLPNTVLEEQLKKLE